VTTTFGTYGRRFGSVAERTDELGAATRDRASRVTGVLQEPSA
jgi:hypothetical protein